MKLNVLISVIPLFGGGWALYSQDKPNIILIMTDDQGYGDFSFTGNPYLDTPNMDTLFRQGVFLNNFHVSSVSAPTRAALMTGRYAYRTGVTGVNESRVNLFEDEKTIASYLKEAGYDTALFGKWHLGYNYPMRPCDKGFDEYCTWEEMQFYRTDPIMEENGVNVKYDGRFLTDVIFEKAIDYLKRKESDATPFFMYLATYLPHSHHDGLQVPEKYSEKFDKYDELKWNVRQCYGMVEKVDEQLGRFLAQLEQSGLSENTVIIFGTDNGPATCYPGMERICQQRYNAGLRGMKGSCYEGGIRTPWCFVWKGRFAAGTVVNRFSAHVDILPTVLDITGLRPDGDHVLDGHSIYPVLKGEAACNVPDTRYYYQVAFDGNSIEGREWDKCCYVENGFKLVEGRELYDLVNDREEKFDLAGRYPEMLETMRARCADFLEEQVAERSFRYQPNIIGSGRQGRTNLMYFEYVPDRKGWPVRVVSRDTPYDIVIYDVQNDVIADGASFVLEAGGRKWKKRISGGHDNVEFKNIRLPEGEYFLKLYIEGDDFPKKFSVWTPEQGRYHAREYGRRLVTVTSRSGQRDDQGVASSIKLYKNL